MAVHYSIRGVRGNVAFLEVDNPPVNALSTSVRRGIRDNIEKANGDRKVSSIVLCGRRQFLAGADIREFRTGESLNEPMLTDLTHILEDNKKPIVAAVSGFALGGGFEIAISSHYRVAEAKTRFGFPEVDIGILPGASGSQRYPRLVGLKHALDIIPTGRRISAQEALKVGAIDKIIDGNLAVEAVKYAESIAGKPLDARRTSKLSIKGAEHAREYAEEAMRFAKTKRRGMIAPLYCIKAVMAAVEYPFEDGMAKERDLSIYLASGGQARALQHAFFAERSSPKWELPSGANSTNTKGRPVNSVGIVGAGTMGTGIAMAVLNIGVPVTLVEQDQKFLDKGVKALQELYAGSVRLGRMTEAQAKSILAKLKPTVNLQDLAKVDLVIEAVFEKMSLKKEIFSKLDKICKPETILASNTSSLSIDEITSATSRPEKVMGMHFFVPAYYMRVLENIRGEKTSADTVATVMNFSKRIGKVPFLCGNCPSFAANRAFLPRASEGMFMVEEGTLPHEVDQALEDFGFPMGMFKQADLSGLDIGYNVRRERLAKQGLKPDVSRRFLNGSRYCPISDILCEQGRFGRKAGKGFYKYEKVGGKVAYPDGAVTELIVKYRRDNGITSRRISPQEITERCLFSLINECFKILEEGIVSKPEDLDTAAILGYSWPRYTGGPMFYANQIGIPKVYERINYYYNEHPDCPHWQPSELLKKIASSDKDVPMSKWTKFLSSHL